LAKVRTCDKCSDRLTVESRACATWAERQAFYQQSGADWLCFDGDEIKPQHLPGHNVGWLMEWEGWEVIPLPDEFELMDVIRWPVLFRRSALVATGIMETTIPDMYHKDWEIARVLVRAGWQGGKL
jgi:hypothetical protein